MTGSLVADAEHLDEVLALSLEHVRRSRTEPGCLSHAVHRDVEDSRRLVFLERWTDAEALQRHLAVPEVRAFARRAAQLVTEPPTLEVYEAQQRPAGLTG